MISIILDVAIGLVLVYVLFSIFVATIVEVISTVLKLRAAALENAFARLLEDPTTFKGAKLSFGWLGLLTAFSMFGGHKKLAVAQQQTRAAAAAANPPNVPLLPSPLAYSAVFQHPLVGGTQAQNLPAYVSSQNFTSALLYVLRGTATGTIFSDFECAVAQLPDGSLRTTLATLIREAQGDLGTLKTGIGRWYDSSMATLSGDYKRFAQLITFLVGFALAAACNVDTIHMVERLYAEPALRSSLASTAARYVASHPKAAAAASPTTEDVEAEFSAAQKAEDLLMKTAPIGWNSAQIPIAGDGANPSVGYRIAWLVLAILGWLVTAIAAMLGAPFWFDLLQKLVSVRNTGPKPSDASSSRSG